MGDTRIETPSGVVNGVNQDFTLSRPYVPGSAVHFLDGLLQNPALDDGLIELNPSAGIVRLKEPPLGPSGTVAAEQVQVLYEDATDGIPVQGTQELRAVVTVDLELVALVEDALTLGGAVAPLSILLGELDSTTLHGVVQADQTLIAAIEVCL